MHAPSVQTWIAFAGAPGCLVACCFCGAALKLPLPAWSKSSLQCPTLTKVTTPEEIVHPVLVPSTVIATVSPELAVAVGV